MGYYTSYKDRATDIIYCDQTQTICTSFTDSLTRTVCTEINPRDCTGNGCTNLIINNGLLLCTEDSSWNCNLCSNDLPYYNPIKQGDELNFQFQQLDDVNTIGKFPTFTDGWKSVCNVFLKDCCSNDYLEVGGHIKSIVDYCSKYYVGQFYDPKPNTSASTWFKPIQGIKIPISSALLSDFHTQFPTSDCFTLQFEFYFGGTTTYFYTEPYRLEPCKDTLIIESLYRKFDCNNYYYGDITQTTGLPGVPYTQYPFVYTNDIRIPAYMELKSFTEKKDFFGNLNFTKSSQLIENYKFTTNRIPIKLAVLIANILAGEKVYIGNGEFYSDGEITKNNEVGNQWFMEADLKRINCTTTFTCN